MVQERHGSEQFNKWRLSYETAPPPVSPFSGNYPGNDERYVENVCMYVCMYLFICDCIVLYCICMYSTLWNLYCASVSLQVVYNILVVPEIRMIF